MRPHKSNLPILNMPTTTIALHPTSQASNLHALKSEHWHLAVEETLELDTFSTVSE